MGSLYTSVLPNIICKEVEDVLNETKAPIMYTCNIVTQPGETDGFKVSDHINVLEKHLGENTIDAVVANTDKLPKSAALLAKSEGKDQVIIDERKLAKKGVHVIKDKLCKVENGYIRHDAMKTAYLIYSYSY